MKILLVNKFYYPRGGDCIYTLNLESLLKSKGHEVAVFSMQHPENWDTPYQSYFPSETKFSLSRNLFETLRRPLGSNEVKKKFTRLLDDFQPDIVHLNNIHSQVSPQVAKITWEKGIKVIWTLHDFKLLCPRYDCLRNRRPCQLCFLDKTNVLKYICMKNSILASFLSYLEAKKWNRQQLEKYTAQFICPSNFMREKMRQGQFSSNKLTVMSNFIDIQKVQQTVLDSKGDYYCYVGRLSEEKGVETLLQAASTLPYPLKIIGTGPLLEDLRKKYRQDHLVFEGYKSWDELKPILSRALFTVMPSECYENNPLSMLESLSLGIPVLGAKIGGIPGLICENQNGLLFESGNIQDLKEKIIRFYENSPAFNYAQIAQESQIRYSSEKYYTRLMEIYCGGEF